MTGKKLGIDIDGVLANFVDGFNLLIGKRYAKYLPKQTDDYPTVWDWYKAEGITDDQDKTLWGMVNDSPSFWRDLPSFTDTKFNLSLLSAIVEMGNDVYFVTIRPGPSAKSQ